MNFFDNKKAQASVGVVLFLSISGLVTWLFLSKEKPPKDSQDEKHSSPNKFEYKEPTAQYKIESACMKILEGCVEDEALLRIVTADQLNATYEKFVKGNLKLSKDKAAVEKNRVKAQERLKKMTEVSKDNALEDEQKRVAAEAAAKYYEQKGKIMQDLKTSIEAYDSAGFTNNMTALTELRTSYTGTDNDPTANRRIPSATSEAIKTMLATCLKNEIIQKHSALFSTPESPFPGEKLVAIVAIREALGLTEYDSKHFKTVAEYEAHLASFRTEKYYMTKESILVALRADIEDFDSAKFARDLQSLVTLRTSFKDNDEDPIAATRIPVATEEGIKTMLATLLNTEIIQKHEALFNPPATAFPKNKLAAIVAIREALGFTEYTGTKQSKTIEDYYEALRNEAFEQFIAALQDPAAVLANAKTALFTTLSSLGTIGEYAILTLPYHLAVIEGADPTIENEVLFFALASYLLPLNKLSFTDGLYIFNRTSPTYKLASFRKICHHFHPAKEAMSEDDLLDFVFSYYDTLLTNYEVFPRKIAFLSLNKRLLSAEEFALRWDADGLLGSSAKCAQPPSYEFFLYCVHVLYPDSKGEVITGRFGNVIDHEAAFKREMAERTLESSFQIIATATPTTADIDKYQHEVFKVLEQKRLVLSHTLTRNRLLELFFKYDNVTICNFLSRKSALKAEIGRLKNLLHTSLTNRSNEGVMHYFSILDAIFTELKKPAKQQALQKEVIAAVKPIYEVALKFLSKENAKTIHFVHSFCKLFKLQTRINHRFRSNQPMTFTFEPFTSESALQNNLHEIVDPYFAEAQESLVKGGGIDLENDTMYPTLQLAMRYYLKEPCALSNIAKQMNSMPAISTNEPSLRLVAKYNYLPKLLDFIMNEINYTDHQLVDYVISNFSIISEELKGAACFPEILREIPAKGIPPFWLIKVSTTPAEFRTLCNVQPARKAKIVADTQAQIATFLTIPGKAALAPVCQQHLELLNETK